MTIPRQARSELQIHLFDSNLSTPVFQANLTDRAQGLRFSTKVPGGYGSCRFTLSTTRAEQWEWHTKRFFWRLTIEDGTKTVFEGRLEDTPIDLTRGTTLLTFYGYYSNLTDVAWATTKNQVWSTTIKDVLTANASQISSDQSNIAATDITIDLDDKYLDIYPMQLFDLLLPFGDTSDNTYDFAIWEDRIPFLTVRNVSSIDWNVNIADFQSFRLTRQLRNVWNSTYAVYLAAGNLTRTATTTDTDSIERFGLTRDYVVPQLGAVSQTAAEAARDTWLAEHKDIFSEADRVILKSTATDTNGVSFPSSWVRAGDVLRVRDLVPPSGALGSVSRDQERTYFITETEYDATRRTNKLILDKPSRTLTSFLARNINVIR